jgi:hypothetical protein
LGELFVVQIAPEFVEVKIIATSVLVVNPMATNFEPSADEAMDHQYRLGALFVAQVAPEFVEV